MQRSIEKRIYAELKQTSTNFYYIEGLIDQQNSRRKFYDGFLACITIVSSFTGLYNLLIYNKAVLAAGIISTLLGAILIIVNKFSSVFLLNTIEISRLNTLYVDFHKYFDELQNLLIIVRSDQQNTNYKRIQEKLTDINAKYSIYKIQVSSIFGSPNEKLSMEAANRSDELLDEIYGID